MAEKIALYFVPANDGDHVAGIPARDLTEAEVAELAMREPAALLNATTPHPGSGKAMYVKTAPKGKRGAATTAEEPAAAPEEGAE